MPFTITEEMGGNIPAAVANAMLAGGSGVPMSLVDLQLVDGTIMYLADGLIQAAPVLAVAPTLSEGLFTPELHPILPPTSVEPTNATYLPWITEPPPFNITNTLVTPSSSMRVQNVTGNTVKRDSAVLFSEQDLWGALFVYRLWNPTCEYALLTIVGQIGDTEIDDPEMELTLEGWLNFAKIVAPDCEINNNCQNIFGSQQCGSTSSTRCLNSYGNCSQLNRFKGLITQWNSGVYDITTNAGIVQPVPPITLNPRRPS